MLATVAGLTGQIASFTHCSILLEDHSTGMHYFLCRPHILAFHYSGNLPNQSFARVQVFSKWTQTSDWIVWTWNKLDNYGTCPGTHLWV